MIKIACLIVILANIFVFLLEYRSGALLPENTTTESQHLIEKEKIVLINEQQAMPTSLSAQENQAGNNNEAQQYIQNSDSIDKVNPTTGTARPQLP